MKKVLLLLMTIILNSCVVTKEFYIIAEDNNGNSLQTSIPKKLKPKVGKYVIIGDNKFKIIEVSKKRPTNTFR